MYRVVCEQSCERAHHGSLCEPGYATILCRHGYIYVHGTSQLGASTNKRGPTSRALAALPCVSVVQDGDDGINAIFHLDDFDKVAAIMQPKRKRRLTPEQRERLIAAGAGHRFASRRGANRSRKVLPRVPAGVNVQVATEGVRA
jgi:hypothetical protein